jgi:hypothetical protein
MNYRLLTPGIVLVSFAAALGLTRGHDDRIDTTAARSPALLAAAATLRPAMATTVQNPAAEPTVVVLPGTSLEPVIRDAEPAAKDAIPAEVTPQDLAQESEGFLDARDRAAEHGARSH